jgi:hypothetical protein
MSIDPTRGLRIYVARTFISRDEFGQPVDCTNRGVSATCDRLTLVGTILRDERTGGERVIPVPADSRVFGESADAPAVALRKRSTSIHLVPVLWDPTTQAYAPPRKHYMAGGNYASLGDSRAYRAATAALGADFFGAVSIHDRYEG